MLMKDFWKILKRFTAPYKWYLFGAVGINILSAIFNIFSFTLIIPILQILFKMDTTVYQFIPWGTEGTAFKDVLMNNMYYYITIIIDRYGPSMTLLFIGPSSMISGVA